MIWPSSIREINALPDSEKYAIYQTLIPEWLFNEYGIETFSHEPQSIVDQPVIIFRCPDKSRSVEITIKRRASELDPLLYLHMADTFNNQLVVLLVVVNDPDAPRFNTDVDVHGNRTQFGTSLRNIAAEVDAMRAGLAPGQVRRGLRKFRDMVPLFETFVGKIGHDIFFIEPLAYHNAIIFERYGFNYLKGYNEMVDIHRQFLPGGTLHQKLSVDQPFRQPSYWQTVRGRSWSIHDGILGHPFTGFQMYKHIHTHAGVNTFPNAIW